MNSPTTKQHIVATQPTTPPIKPTASPVDLKLANVTSQNDAKPVSFMTSQQADAKPPNPMTSQNLLNFRSFVLHSWLLHNMQQNPPVAKATAATAPPSVQPQQPGFNPHQIRVVCEALQCDVERLARFLWSLPAHPQVIQVRVVNQFYDIYVPIE